MSVSIPAVTIVPDRAAVPTPLPLPTKARPGALLNAIVNLGSEAIAQALEGISALKRSRQADAHHDLDLEQAARAAAMNGQMAQIQGCGCAPAFDRILALIASARRHDAHEDGWITKALTLFIGAVSVLRGLNRRAEDEITKRGYRRA